MKGQHLRGAIYDRRLNDEVSRPFRERLGALVDAHRAMAVACQLDLDVSWRARRVWSATGVGEALTNARRHAGARHVRVSARGSEDRIRIQVDDDGRGFDPATEPSGRCSEGLQADARAGRPARRRPIDTGAAMVLDKTADLDEVVETVRRLHRGAASPDPR